MEDKGTVSIFDVYQYASDNEEIINKANMGSVDINDILTNIKSACQFASYVNEQFSGLEDISEIPTIDVSYYENLQIDGDKLFNSYKEEVTLLLSAVKYYENAIKNYDSGEIPTFNSFIETASEEEMNDLLEQVLEIKKDGLSFLFSYTDNMYNVGLSADTGLTNYDNTLNVLTGMGTKFAFGKVIKEMYKKTSAIAASSTAASIWVSSAGGVLAALGRGLIDLLADEGEMTDLDWERLGFDMGAAAGSFATWAAISGCFASVPGIGWIAGGAAFVVGLVINKIGDLFTGDYIVDKFTMDGETYEVPRNGNGKYGTYDVILERFGNDRYFINGEEYSEHNYKSMLYSDVDKFIKFNNDHNFYYNDEILTLFNEVLDEVAKCDNAEQAESLFFGFVHDEVNHYKYWRWGTQLDEMYIRLRDVYGFSFGEYYTYRKAGAI